MVACVDGRRQTVAAGGVVLLSPGESITLFPGTYHAFWGGRRRSSSDLGLNSMARARLSRCHWLLICSRSTEIAKLLGRVGGSPTRG